MSESGVKVVEGGWSFEALAALNINYLDKSVRCLWDLSYINSRLQLLYTVGLKIV